MQTSALRHAPLGSQQTSTTSSRCLVRHSCSAFTQQLENKTQCLCRMPAGQLPTALDLCRARSQRPVLSQVRSTMEMLTRRQCTVRLLVMHFSCACCKPDAHIHCWLQVDQLLQMKHLMPGIVRVQRLLGPSDELLVSLARPAAAAAASPAAAPGSATKAHQHADLQAAFAAKLLAHQEQRQQQPPPPPQSPLRDATAQHAQGSPRKASPRKAAPAQHSVPLAPISPFRGTPSSAAAAPIAAALGSAATPLPQSRLPFASAKTPASAACRKGSTPRARLSFGLQGPTPELPELPAKGSETELQRRLKRQSSSGLLPISLNVLQASPQLCCTKQCEPHASRPHNRHIPTGSHPQSCLKTALLSAQQALSRARTSSAPPASHLHC